MTQELFDAFQSLEIRVGAVVSAEINPKARNASYKMRIDFGDLGERSCSGQYPPLYRPEDLIGRQVVCVMNLGARRIAGFDSQVLMLGAPNPEGHAVFLTTERDTPLGARVF